MANDEIRDLIGRYATGSLTADEQKRLFDAALDDQDVFNEIAQEQDIKKLLAEPGARDRLIHALEPPRKQAWIFGVAATAALTVLIAAVLLRPAPKPPQVAAVKPAPQAAEMAAPPEAAPATPTPLADKPTNAPPPVAAEEPAKQKAAEEPARDASKDVQAVEKTEKKAENKSAENRAEDRKELDQVATARPPGAPAPLPSPAPLVSPAPATPAPAPPPSDARSAAPSSARAGEAMRSPVQMQRAGGPRQQQGQQTTQQKTGVAGGAVSSLAALPPFGFHYSVETKGHLVLIPAADGYLTVKSNDGSTLFSSKRVATGIIIDVALPDGATSVSVSFATSALPLSTPTPAIRTEPEGTVEGASRVAVEIKISP
jgi:hypothetical protein